MLLPGFQNFSVMSTQVCLLLNTKITLKTKILFNFLIHKAVFEILISAVLRLGDDDPEAICTTMNEHFDHVTYLDYNYKFGIFVGLLSGLTVILTFYSRENVKGGYFDNFFFVFNTIDCEFFTNYLR